MKTRMNGGIPPTVTRMEVIMVEYMIGTGKEGDPLRNVTAIYDSVGEHIATVDTWKEEE